MKYVVASVYRGSSSIEDAVSDIKAEPGGFHEAGFNATNKLYRYVKSQGLTKGNTILFATGHSYHIPGDDYERRYRLEGFHLWVFPRHAQLHPPRPDR